MQRSIAVRFHSNFCQRLSWIEVCLTADNHAVQEEALYASGLSFMNVSWLRIALMVGGVVALIPLTLLFGVWGFLATLFFLLLAALAK